MRILACIDRRYRRRCYPSPLCIKSHPILHCNAGECVSHYILYFHTTSVPAKLV
jgi:hypothetical protein